MQIILRSNSQLENTGRQELAAREHNAARPQPLPLLHEVEERAGERRRLSWQTAEPPLSSVLSPLLRRGERKKILAAREDSDAQQYKEKLSVLCVLCAFLWLALPFTVSASAATLYVWQDSPSPAPPYTNWATTANVILDGSRSSDPDGDPLTYLWFSTLNSQPSTLLATGMIATVQLPVGTNLIALVVNDGLAASTNTVAVTVLTTGQAVERLIALVNESDLRHKRPLLATLEAALASIQRGNCHSAVGQVHAFQNKVRAQVSREDSDLAMELTNAANQVIAALDCDGSPRVAAKIHSLKRHADGSLQLRIEGKVGQRYVVEASTNLVHWETVGTANLKGDGSIEFEDPDALKHQRRFYRVVEP